MAKQFKDITSITMAQAFVIYKMESNKQEFELQQLEFVLLEFMLVNQLNSCGEPLSSKLQTTQRRQLSSAVYRQCQVIVEVNT